MSPRAQKHIQPNNQITAIEKCLSQHIASQTPALKEMADPGVVSASEYHPGSLLSVAGVMNNGNNYLALTFLMTTLLPSNSQPTPSSAVSRGQAEWAQVSKKDKSTLR